MLKVYWNINNKKHCQITTELQASSSSIILKISQTQENIQSEGKLLFQPSVLIRINQIKLV
ncbi:hypothetical protein [Spiroplasma citri]|uniref:hypothetical protein n=1 Tax=Spiroplasma citri TaxID=2133 RepID=UPI001EE37715|nr:hypothetical protein [Spiroplasma citri]WFG98236.1 hypothetical protein M1770_09395 [Spiroplasma citri]